MAPKVDRTKKLQPPSEPIPMSSSFESSLVDSKEPRLD